MLGNFVMSTSLLDFTSFPANTCPPLPGPEGLYSRMAKAELVAAATTAATTATREAAIPASLSGCHENGPKDGPEGKSGASGATYCL
jgi:hypothetical protein